MQTPDNAPARYWERPPYRWEFQHWQIEEWTLLTDPSAPTSALFRPAVEWQGLENARRAGWAV